MLRPRVGTGSLLVAAIALAGAQATAQPRAVEDLLPLSQPAQNYFVEAILGGVYGHAASPFYSEFRSDGLLTRGTARFTTDPAICIVGPANPSAVRTSIEMLLTDAVDKLTAGKRAPIYLPSSCWDKAFPESPYDLGCPELPGNQVTVFLWQGGGFQGLPCQGTAALPPVGGVITGGRLTGPLPLDENLPPETAQTLRHELGHVFGLEHTWGDPNLMLYRSGRTIDFAPLELEAFAALYELPPGTGLGALIGTGVVHDDPAVLNEPPAIERTTISGQYQENNHGAVGQHIVLWGQRLTLAFATESVVSYRPLNYAPPVVTFGTVPVVPDVREPYQTDPVSWFGHPAAVLKVSVPLGASTPIHVSTHGQSATFPGFTLDGPSVPFPPSTPKAVVGLSCQKTRQGNFLTWSLPPTFADDATALHFGQVIRRILRNGVVIAELSDGLGFVDGAAYPSYEAHLYQVVLVNVANGQDGIPSSVCALPSSLAPSTFTASPTSTLTPLPTSTASPSPTLPVATPTSTNPPRPTHTATPTATPVPSATPSSPPTASSTPAPTQTATPGSSPTVPAPTPTNSSLPTRTHTPVATRTDAPTATPTSPLTATQTPTPPSATPTEPITPEPACTGDCGHDGSVTVNDLVLMVNIALGNADTGSCAAGDFNGDGLIVINELILAVNNALNGCP